MIIIRMSYKKQPQTNQQDIQSNLKWNHQHQKHAIFFYPKSTCINQNTPMTFYFVRNMPSDMTEE